MKDIMKDKGMIIILSVIVVVLSLISVFVGAYDVTLSGVLSGETHQLMLMLNSRMPRLMAILCTGVGMSVAGLLMQNLCRNKFVSPTTGATISSAQFGIIVALVFMPTANLATRTIFAFIFAVLGTWIFVAFVQKMPLREIIMVPLIGIMFNSVIGGVVSYLAYENDLAQILSNMLVGDFSLILAGRYEIVFLILPLVVVAYIFANHFNIVGMGQDFANNLGVNYKLVMFGGLTIAALITASVVVTVGTISYIGLIVPNIVSMFKGDKMRGTIFDVGLFGMAFVLICDIIGRVINKPYELPIELIAGVVGSLVFIMIMYKNLGGGKRRKKVTRGEC